MLQFRLNVPSYAVSRYIQSHKGCIIIHTIYGGGNCQETCKPKLQDSVRKHLTVTHHKMVWSAIQADKSLCYISSSFLKIFKWDGNPSTTILPMIIVSVMAR